MKMNNIECNYYTTKEMAKILKISLSVAYRLTKAEGFPKKLIGKRRFLIPINELKVWLSKHCNGL